MGKIDKDDINEIAVQLIAEAVGGNGYAYEENEEVEKSLNRMYGAVRGILRYTEILKIKVENG